MKAVTDAMVELVNAKEAFQVLEGWVSVDRSAMHSAFEQ